MKRLTVTKLLALGLCVLTIASCTDTQVASNETISEGPSKGSEVLVANANPMVVFKSTIIVKRTSYPNITVMDADGTDQTEIYRGQTASLFRKPTWAPTGNGTATSPWSVSFTEQISGATYLKRVNVWVQNGTVRSSTPMTLVSFSSTSGKAVRQQSWSPSTTTSEIGYVELSINPAVPYSKFCVIPAVGGTATQLDSVTVVTGALTWSGDGSKLAYQASTASEGAHIRILDRNSPTTPHRVILANQHTAISYIDWSHSGANTIAYDGDSYLYTINLSDSMPTPSQVLSSSQHVAGKDPAWSSDNSSLTYTNGGSGIRKIVLSGGTVSTLATSGIFSDWRP